MNQRQQLEKLLIEKALKDETFKNRLIENPAAVIQAEAGMIIPEEMKIVVLEEDSTTVYLTLPALSVKDSDLELSEAELESVSGGTEGGGGQAVGWTKINEC